jgi:excisionase family DNA binding protein
MEQQVVNESIGSALPTVSPLVTSRDTARYLNISESTLSRWRAEKKGPTYLQLGGVIRYRRDALDAWLNGLEQADEHS